MDIDYSKFDIDADWHYPFMGGRVWEFVFTAGSVRISSNNNYTTKRAAIRGAKRAIKRIVETAVGDK